jgi:hypothetical protein
MGLFDLIYHYAIEVYGREAIKKWLKANKENSVLDRLNPTDLAFALLVYENYSPKWVEDIEQDRLDCAAIDAGTNDEDEKNKRKRNDSMQAEKGLEEKKKRRRFSGKYTKDSRCKNSYLQSGWTEDGMQRYDELCRIFNSLFQSRDVWLKCKVGWNMYIVKKKEVGGECWVPTYRREVVDETESDQDIGGDDNNGWFQYVSFRSEEVTGSIDFKGVTRKQGV